MSTHFVQEIKQYRAILANKQADRDKKSKDKYRKAEEKSTEDSINNIGKLIAKLEKTPYKATLIKEACTLFHEENFDDIMNKDLVFLFPHINCVVEIDDTTKSAIRRSGEPEDHITKNTGSRLEEYSLSSPIVQELLTWLAQLFPDESLRHEFIKWLASTIRGPNMDKKCTMLTGPSNGGKTTLFKCIALALGPFYVTWEASDLLRATQPGSANPSVAKARYAKLVAIEEVGKNTVIAGELLKKITGNGKMNGRELFTQGENGWVANFKFAMAFNQSMPKIDDADEAAMMRMMPIPMASRWVWKLPGTPEESAKKRIFKADRFFDKKLPALARALAWYMVHYYPIYAEEGLKDHEAIESMVNAYWRELDDYGQFMDEVLEKITDSRGKLNEKAVVSVDDVFQEFLTWFSQANSGFKQKPPKRSEFKREMEKDNHLGPIDEKVDGWRGWAFKQAGGKKKRKMSTKGG
jgi:phage/plasmid-associated DNA primase